MQLLSRLNLMMAQNIGIHGILVHLFTDILGEGTVSKQNPSGHLVKSRGTVPFEHNPYNIISDKHFLETILSALQS